MKGKCIRQNPDLDPDLNLEHCIGVNIVNVVFCNEVSPELVLASLW